MLSAELPSNGSRLRQYPLQSAESRYLRFEAQISVKFPKLIDRASIQKFVNSIQSLAAPRASAGEAAQREQARAADLRGEERVAEPVQREARGRRLRREALDGPHLHHPTTIDFTATFKVSPKPIV